jgi:hypothetical protein
MMRSAFWLAIVACVFVLAVDTGGRAQGLGEQAQIAQPIQPLTPTVVSGGDLGFRVEGRRGNTPVGTLVIRINGQWVDVEVAHGAGVRMTPR